MAQATWLLSHNWLCTVAAKLVSPAKSQVLLSVLDHCNEMAYHRRDIELLLFCSVCSCNSHAEMITIQDSSFVQ